VAMFLISGHLFQSQTVNFVRVVENITDIIRVLGGGGRCTQSFGGET
jgi:hypothetical protein